MAAEVKGRGVIISKTVGLLGATTVVVQNSYSTETMTITLTTDEAKMLTIGMEYDVNVRTS